MQIYKLILLSFLLIKTNTFILKAQEIDNNINYVEKLNTISVNSLSGILYGFEYNRELTKRKKYNANAGIGITSSISFFLPPKISFPIDLNVTNGKKHRLSLGIKIMPIIWFTDKYIENNISIFGSSSSTNIYSKNTFSIPTFFRVGYNYRTPSDAFIKLSAGPKLFEIYNNYPTFKEFNFETKDFSTEFSALGYIWPEIGIGLIF